MHQHLQSQDEHSHRNLELTEEPLDAANQSLADALRSSFRILKGIMMVLVVLYLFSHVKCLGPHEQALVLRLGALQEEVHEAGLLWALPFPIDEIVPLPSFASNTFLVKSHTFKRAANEEGKPLSFIHRGMNMGLKPGLDGALITADKGLVHVQWKVTFNIEDVQSYVTNIYELKDVTSYVGEAELTGGTEAAVALITTMLENAAIEVASGLTADEIIRTRVDYAQSEIKHLVNARLQELESGVFVNTVEMVEPIPPVQVRGYFENTQRAENMRQEQIHQAEQERTRILSDAAGAAYPEVVRVLDELDAHGEDAEAPARLNVELDDLLTDEVEGAAGQVIKDAGAVFSETVRRMEGDVELYRTLLPEYERNPRLLVERLWQDTWETIFERPGVVTLYRPLGTQEFRLLLTRDPEQRRMDEERRLQEQRSSGSSKPQGPMVPVPGYD